MKRYSYSTTSVAVGKSQEKIRELLYSAGVRGVQFSENFETGEINVKFAKDVDGNLRTVSVTMKIPEVPASKRKQPLRRWSRGRVVEYAPKDRKAQLERATYRALHYWLKSQFEAVDFGLLSFEEVFLAHFEWMIRGRSTTVAKMVLPHLGNGTNFLPKPGDTAIEGESREVN